VSGISGRSWDAVLTAEQSFALGDVLSPSIVLAVGTERSVRARRKDLASIHCRQVKDGMRTRLAFYRNALWASQKRAPGDD
jgi:hypothetical protein